MYVPHFFKNDTLEEVRSFIENNGFGILIAQGESKISASHIPLQLHTNEAGENLLCGHISKGNPQWKSFENGRDVLAIFSGPHTYISSSWYDHENVPTWNYIAVHVYGTIRIQESSELVKSLKRLVDNYEKKSINPVSVEKMSENFLANEMKGIVGFEIKITEIEAAFKLSQNRDSNNHDAIVLELEKKGDPGSIAIAHEMKNRGK